MRTIEKVGGRRAAGSVRSVREKGEVSPPLRYLLGPVYKEGGLP